MPVPRLATVDTVTYHSQYGFQYLEGYRPQFWQSSNKEPDILPKLHLALPHGLMSRLTSLIKGTSSPEFPITWPRRKPPHGQDTRSRCR